MLIIRMEFHPQEPCLVDSHKLIKGVRAFWMDASEGKQIGKAVVGFNRKVCLLYTSDAADD